MAWQYLTASGAQTVSGPCSKLLLTVNTALTGTITVTDGGSTVAVITNPTVGSRYEYWDLKGAVLVNPSATCDITANTYGGFGPK